jgi:hypothetical protein
MLYSLLGGYLGWCLIGIENSERIVPVWTVMADLFDGNDRSVAVLQLIFLHLI